MVEENRSLIQRLKQWLFGKRKEARANQKERRDEMSTFMEERAEEKRAAAAREKRQ